MPIRDSDIHWNMDEFVRVRKVAALEAMFAERGAEWTDRLNNELHAAQAKRGQPVVDGYDFHIHSGGNRLRMYIVAFTARAQAHERAHSSILKLMETTKYDVKTRAQLQAVAAKDAARAKQRQTRLAVADR